MYNEGTGSVFCPFLDARGTRGYPLPPAAFPSYHKNTKAERDRVLRLESQPNIIIAD